MNQGRTDKDPEIKAMKGIVKLLNGLSEDEIKRVLWWINEVYLQKKEEQE